MIKKITLWTIYVLIVGVLVFGAVNRTSAKTDQGILFGNVEEKAAGRGQETYDHDEMAEDLDWISFSGKVIAVRAEVLEIQTVSDGVLEIEGRPWRFVQELGYVPTEGTEVVASGFFENGEFEVATIRDLTTDQIFKLRDESGKPMWGGGGRN